MAIAILIGFNYGEMCKKLDESFTTHYLLPGIEIDLYRVYTYCKRKKFKQIYVITDITNDPQLTETLPLVVDDHIDAGILHFISTLKQRNEYMAVDINDFNEQLTTLITNHQVQESVVGGNLFFYYTGHGVKNFLLLPGLNTKPILKNAQKSSDDMVHSKEPKLEKISLLKKCPIFDIRDIMLMRNTRDKVNLYYKEIVIIFDCCHASNLNLSYVFDGNKFKLSQFDYLIDRDILLLASTSENNKAISSTKGSPFTYQLIKNLLQNPMKISELYNSLQPSAHVYSSLPLTNNLWPWLYGAQLNLNYCPENVTINVEFYNSMPNRNSDRRHYEIISPDSIHFFENENIVFQ